MNATPDKSANRVRAMFGDIAGSYDLLNHLLSGNQDRRWRRRAVRQLAPRRGERVLDLCCGTGDLALEVCRQQPRCTVTAADFALPMLRLARQKSQPAGPVARTAPSSWLAGDALCLPFVDATFDAVLVGFGVRNFETLGSGLHEMQRVMKPGGRLLVLEFMRPSSQALNFGFGLFFKHILPRIGRLLSRHGSAYDYLPASVGSFFTRGEFEGLLARAGFARVRSFDFSAGIASSFLARKAA